MSVVSFEGGWEGGGMGTKRERGATLSLLVEVCGVEEER